MREWGAVAGQDALPPEQTLYKGLAPPRGASVAGGAAVRCSLASWPLPSLFRPRVPLTWTTVLPDTPSTPTATGRAASSLAPGTWTTCECVGLKATTTDPECTCDLALPGLRGWRAAWCATRPAHVSRTHRRRGHVAWKGLPGSCGADAPGLRGGCHSARWAHIPVRTCATLRVSSHRQCPPVGGGSGRQLRARSVWHGHPVWGPWLAQGVGALRCDV